MNAGSSELRVLVADELEIVRDALRILLSARPAWGVCAEAINGREAVQKAIQSRPDVAVLDLNLPELNGLEASRQIRQALPGTEILLLAMQNSERLTQDAFDTGAHSLILKSEVKRLLVPAIESLARHNPFFSAVPPGPTKQIWPESAAPSGRTARLRSRLTPREREIVQLVVEG